MGAPPEPSRHAHPAHLAPRALLAATTPADVDPRAFFQDRLALCVAFLGGAWALAWVAHLSLLAIFARSWLPEVLRFPPTWVHFATVVAMGATWRVLRRGPRSLSSLLRIDAAWFLGQALVVGGMLAFNPKAFRPDTTFAFAISFLLILRAAVIPSSAKRMAVLGILASAPTAVATYAVYARGEATALVPAAAWAAIGISIWLGVTVVGATLISGVIYGLRKRVQDAMELGQYTLEEKIGEGGMGVVYRARHALLRRPTAVKVLAEGHTSPAALARFEREVQLTSELANPHIVSVYDFGRTQEGQFYYAMEFLDGIDLDHIMRLDGPQPEGRVVAILLQLAEALAEAHHVGLVHRDIKPGNAILCEHARQGEIVKLVDFGLVREFGADTGSPENHAVAGTPHYMAPEAITDPASADTRADLYALGALGYALLTGTHVFDGKDAMEVLGHQLHSPVEPPSLRRGSKVSAHLEATLLACLEKDAEKRPATAEDLVALLRSCTDAAPWTLADSDAWWEARAPQLRTQRTLEAAKTTQVRSKDALSA